jgi:phosphate:Na+ symporter
MTTFNAVIAIVATISLFLFSLRGFSKELQAHGAERLKNWLSKITSNRFSGFLLGAVLTAVIQSSSAVTSITVSLVDSGVIAFFNSLAVLVGANVGTSFTAWLVAFKLDYLGSWLIVIGTIVGFLPHRIHLAGKSIFYLGLILFSLQLISHTLEPLSERPEVFSILAQADTIYIGILAGMIITALVQSSSVTTGLTIILAGQGFLGLPGAIAIVIGCNLGTTSTALLASLSLSKNAKNVAIANLLLNAIGLLIFLPFIYWFTQIIAATQLDIVYQIAMAHLIFNLVLAAIALVSLKPFSRLILKITSSEVQGG